VEYQVSISAVVISPADVEEKIRTLIACVIGGNPRERDEACLELAKIRDARIVAPAINAWKTLFRGESHEEYTNLASARDILQKTIEEIDDPAAAGPLIEALGDEIPSIRMFAIRALEKIGGPSSLDALLRLAGDPGQEARSSALYTLAAFDDGRIPGVLISALDDSRFHVKSAALRSLGRLRRIESVGKIIGILENSSVTANDDGMPWSKVRAAAATALGDIGADAAAAPLLRAIGDSDSEVRESARGALARIRRITSDESIRTAIGDALNERNK